MFPDASHRSPVTENHTSAPNASLAAAAGGGGIVSREAGQERCAVVGDSVPADAEQDVPRPQSRCSGGGWVHAVHNDACTIQVRNHFDSINGQSTELLLTMSDR